MVKFETDLKMYTEDISMLRKPFLNFIGTETRHDNYDYIGKFDQSEDEYKITLIQLII